MNMQRIFLVAITLVTLGAAIAIFIAVSSGSDGDSVYTPDLRRGGNDSGLWTTSSLITAEELFGQPIARPEFIPEGFTKSEVISITEHITPRDWTTVEQSWADSGQRANFQLSQDSLHAGGLGGGEPYTVAGYEGERRLLPATVNRQPILALSWHDESYSYKLTGSLNGILTEDLLLHIAESVSVD